MTRTVEDSKKINDVTSPCIIISASGMATGGRVLHHLAKRLPDSRSAVLLVGYQAEGTTGRALQDGAQYLRIYGQEVPVRAEIVTLDQLSAHAGRSELLRWLSGFTAPPRQTFLVHGEPNALEGSARRNRQPLPLASGGSVLPAELRFEYLKRRTLAAERLGRAARRTHAKYHPGAATRSYNLPKPIGRGWLMSRLGVNVACGLSCSALFVAMSTARAFQSRRRSTPSRATFTTPRTRPPRKTLPCEFAIPAEVCSRRRPHRRSGAFEFRAAGPRRAYVIAIRVSGIRAS